VTAGEATGGEAAGLTHEHARVNGVRLHYVEAGSGPLVVLLHGFPELWLGWRRQIPMLVEAGFRVVAPDMRGYNLSEKPRGVRAYSRERLAGDVAALIRHLGAERAHVVGHDWGAIVAWYTAIDHPEVVDRLVVLDGPHPRQFVAGLRRPRQLLKSWYVFFFQLPWLPELVLRAGRWRGLRRGFEVDARPGAFPARDIERYVEAWSQPGALTATIAYYRSLGRRFLALTRPRRNPPVEARTMVVWGERDRYLSTDLASPDRRDVPNLEKVVVLPNTSHWVMQDEPEEVGRLLTEFLSA
jgi:pimeloyl-ACP methyl ester carboxylesterase